MLTWGAVILGGIINGLGIGCGLSWYGLGHGWFN